MRLLSVFLKCVREQQRDKWLIGLSLAFAPLFVLLYYLMTGGTGSTSYALLVLNQDVPAARAEGTVLSAGEEMVQGLREMAYPNGDPLLRITLVDDRTVAEARLHNREAAALIIIPEGFSAALLAWQAGDTCAGSDLVFVGDLSNPYYTVAAVMAMTVADNYVTLTSGAERPVNLVEAPLGASEARSEFEIYVPGLLIMAVVLLVFQAAMTPARDIESGVLRRLRLTRVSSFEYLAGTSLWLALVAVLSLLLTFAVAVACGFQSRGALWIAVLVGVLTSFSIIGIGLIVACFSKTVAQAFIIANFPLGFLMFLTGGAFPLPRPVLFSLFGHAVSYADILPPTHAVIALNKVFTLGARFADVLYELTALVLLTTLYFAAGVWLFQRTQMKRG
ncbi:MAG: ABC transporter permease [Anaerolineales bacterium]|nr:ABC transporter permease [Anaerolineales bacterium]